MQPPASPAVVSQEAAEQAALRAMPGRIVREAVLADFSNAHAVPVINTLAWAGADGPTPGLGWSSPWPPGEAVVHGGVYRCHDGGVHHGCWSRTAPALRELTAPPVSPGRPRGSPHAASWTAASLMRWLRRVSVACRMSRIDPRPGGMARRAPGGPPRQSPALTPGSRRRRRRLDLRTAQLGNEALYSYTAFLCCDLAVLSPAAAARLYISSVLPLKISNRRRQSETPIRTALTGDGGVA